MNLKPIYRDIYNFHEKYENTLQDSEWMSLVEEHQQIVKKYNSSKFIRGMMTQVVSEIEDSYKGKVKVMK